MTHDELQAIKARAAAATPGPWTKAFGGTVMGPPHSGPDGDDVVADRISTGDNGTFIAHARTDVPALVAEVERLRKVTQLQMERAWERGWTSRSGGGGDYRRTDIERDRDVAELLATEITDDELT